MQLTFETLFTESNADKLANYIAEEFSNKDGKELEYDFNLSAGTMSGLSSDFPNLSFKFNTEPDTLARQILDLICDEDVEPTQERISLFNDFLQCTGNLIVGKYGDVIRQKIRDYLFGGKPTPEILPLETLKFIFLEIVDLDENEKVTVVDKLVPKGEVDDFGPRKSLANEVNVIRDATGETFEAIISRKKIEGDEAYKYVVGVREEKYGFECQLDLYVDFSFCQKAIDFVNRSIDNEKTQEK